MLILLFSPKPRPIWVTSERDAHADEWMKKQEWYAENGTREQLEIHNLLPSIGLCTDNEGQVLLFERAMRSEAGDRSISPIQYNTSKLIKVEVRELLQCT